MANLFGLVQELQDIVAEADRRRLGVWVETFQAEYPDLAEEIMYCAEMPDAKFVLNYLQQRDQRFAFLRLVPNVENLITFLQNFIRERSNPDAQNNSVLPGNVVPIRRRRPSRSRAT